MCVGNFDGIFCVAYTSRNAAPRPQRQAMNLGRINMNTRSDIGGGWRWEARICADSIANGTRTEHDNKCVLPISCKPHRHQTKPLALDSVLFR